MLVTLSKSSLRASMTLFVSLPLMAGGNQPVIGQVVKSSGAFLGGVAIPAEGTLTAGDVLTTAKGGAALVKFSRDAEANVYEGTSVRFSGEKGRLSAEMSSGAVEASARGKSLVVETPKYKVESTERGKATYLVAMLPDKTTVSVCLLQAPAIRRNPSAASRLRPRAAKPDGVP